MPGERRTIDPQVPGVVEIELDPGLEDTRCIACQAEGISRPARGCPHSEAQRAAAAIETETQIVVALPIPLWARIAAFRKALGARGWWATKEGRRRMRERAEEDEREAKERKRARAEGAELLGLDEGDK